MIPQRLRVSIDPRFRAPVYLLAGAVMGALGVSWLSIDTPRPDPEAVRLMVKAGHVVAETTRRPPKAIQEAVGELPAGVEIVAAATGQERPTEEAPPQVFPVEDPGAPNWTLRPGDLGLKAWTCVFTRKDGIPFAKLEATLEAQTPAGTIERALVAQQETTEAWMRPDVVAARRRVAFDAGASTLGATDVGISVDGKGRLGGTLAVGRDWRRGETYLAGRLRFLIAK